VTCGRRPIREFQMKKPAASFLARAQFLRRWIYAGDLPGVSTFPKAPVASRYRASHHLQIEKARGLFLAAG
jgi:hypothetical protein